MIVLLLCYNIYVTLIFALLLYYNIYVTLILVSLLYYNICTTPYILLPFFLLTFLCYKLSRPPGSITTKKNVSPPTNVCIILQVLSLYFFHHPSTKENLKNIYKIKYEEYNKYNINIINRICLNKIYNR